MMAVDITVGTVASALLPILSFDTCTVYVFFACVLLPSIRGQHRIIMCDNLGAHIDRRLDDLVRSEGHLLLFRPRHSPDFGPVESSFSWIRQFLKVRLSPIRPSARWVLRWCVCTWPCVSVRGRV